MLGCYRGCNTYLCFFFFFWGGGGVWGVGVVGGGGGACGEAPYHIFAIQDPKTSF